MAKIIIHPKDNIKLPRRIDNIFIRQTATGPIAYTRSGIKQPIHPRQQKQMDKFKCATAYANAITGDPEKKKLYGANLEPGETVYLKAMKEFLNRPRAEE